MLKMVKSRFAVETFFSHATEKIFRGSHLRFPNPLVTKPFTGRRGGRGWREYHDFLPEDIFSQCPKLL